MSGGDKLPAWYMFRQALRVMSLLTDVVQRLEIAGSLRRDQQLVGDIELVMDVNEIVPFEQRCSELLDAGIFHKRLNKNGAPIGWGQRFKAVTYNNVPVDLFIVLPDRQWGPTMVLRTGPGTANGVLVTTAGIRNRDGLLGILPPGLAWREGAIWDGDQRLDTPEEIDVFAACGLPYIPPYMRTPAEYQICSRRRIAAGRSVLPASWCELKWRVGPSWKPARQVVPLETQMTLI